MIEEQMTTEQLTELQKKNCPFCKIVKKEIQAKVIYEDDIVIAILDIYPAARGHILLMPKEHYYIMQLIPQNDFNHLFNIGKELIKAIKEAMIVGKVSIFIASGPAAGQQTTHTLIHLIPREKDDKLEVLELKNTEESQEDEIKKIKEKIDLILKPRATQEEKKEIEKKVEKEEKKNDVEKVSDSIELISKVIQNNPELEELIIKNPEMVKNYVDKSPELSVLFENVNIFTLSELLKQKKGISRTKEVPRAIELNDEELYSFIEGKEKLKEWLLENPQELKEIIPQQRGLSIFFFGTDVDVVRERYMKERKRHGNLQ